MKKSVLKTKKKKPKLVTREEIHKNIGFLGTGGKLLKALMEEKKIERLR